jgi:hypothetical protein
VLASCHWKHDPPTTRAAKWAILDGLPGCRLGTVARRVQSSLRGPLDHGAVWESIPQRPEEAVDFLDADAHLGECLVRLMPGIASPRPVRQHGFGEVLQMDEFNQENGFEEPCLDRLGGCYCTPRDVGR